MITLEIHPLQWINPRTHQKRICPVPVHNKKILKSIKEKKITWKEWGLYEREEEINGLKILKIFSSEVKALEWGFRLIKRDFGCIILIGGKITWEQDI